MRDTSCGKFYCERQPVQASADISDDRSFFGVDLNLWRSERRSPNKERDSGRRKEIMGG
jgi:hypothetical protein